MCLCSTGALINSVKLAGLRCLPAQHRQHRAKHVIRTTRYTDEKKMQNWYCRTHRCPDNKITLNEMKSGPAWWWMDEGWRAGQERLERGREESRRLYTHITGNEELLLSSHHDHGSKWRVPSRHQDAQDATVIRHDSSHILSIYVILWNLELKKIPPPSLQVRVRCGKTIPHNSPEKTKQN